MKQIVIKLFSVLSLLVIASCTINYSFTGASIAPEVKTFSITDFPNLASLVAPSLSSTFTNALTDKMNNSTSLDQVKEDGDMHFEGEITNYTSVPVAVTGDEYASLNRLTVTVKVRFTNRFQPENNFDKQFSAYSDFDNNQMLQTVEPVLIPEIVEKLVTDIFNAAASNW